MPRKTIEELNKEVAMMVKPRRKSVEELNKEIYGADYEAIKAKDEEYWRQRENGDLTDTSKPLVQSDSTSELSSGYVAPSVPTLQNKDIGQKDTRSDNKLNFVQGAGYLSEKTASGTLSGLEGIAKSVVDLGMNMASADIAKNNQNLEVSKMFQKLIGNKSSEALVQSAIDANNRVKDVLPESAKMMRPDIAKDYSASINNRYGQQTGLLNVAGEVASGVGNMLPNIVANYFVPGSGVAVMFSSAAGNAADEARKDGADENTAASYGILSGGVEVLTEKLFGGIPGMGTGLLSKGVSGKLSSVMKNIAKSEVGQSVINKAVDILGEGTEEYISSVVGAYLQKMYKKDGKNFLQTLEDIQPEALYSGLLGSLTAGVMNVPNVANKIYNNNPIRRNFSNNYIANANNVKIPPISGNKYVQNSDGQLVLVNDETNANRKNSDEQMNLNTKQNNYIGSDNFTQIQPILPPIRQSSLENKIKENTFNTNVAIQEQGKDVNEENKVLQQNENAFVPNTKSIQAQERFVNNFVASVGDTLSVPGSGTKGNSRQYLKGIATDLANDIKQNGKISPEIADSMFTKAYDEGIVIESSYYDEFAGLKEEIKKTALSLDITGQESQYNAIKKEFGRDMNLSKNEGLPVAIYYKELSETYPGIFDPDVVVPIDQLARIGEVAQGIRKIEMNLDAYNSTAADDFRMYARNDFDKALGEFETQIKKVARYDAAKVAKEASTTTTAQAFDIKQVRLQYEQAKKLQKAADKVMEKELLIDYDKTIVNRLLKGEITLQQMRQDANANTAGIKRVYLAKKALADANSPINQYKAARHNDIDSWVKSIVKESDLWQDKNSGLAYSSENMERNIRDITKRSAAGDKINKEIFAKVHANEARSNKFKNELRNKIKDLKLTQAESELVQINGELSNLDKDSARGKKVWKDEYSNLKKHQKLCLKKYGENLNLAKIDNAIDVFRNVYDTVFELVNDENVRNGYPPIEYRKGYFPHFTVEKPDTLLKKVASKFGFETQRDTLPTDIAGLTYTFKPGRRWNKNALQRTSFESDFDVLKGFDMYLEVASDVIFHTEDIQRLRAFENAIREKHSDEEIKAEIKRIKEDDTLSEREKYEAISAKEPGKLNHFVQEVGEYTNLLAGKKSLHDRTIEKDAGRAVYKVIQNMENRIAANMVAVNPGSWITNFIPLTQATAECSTNSLLKAAEATVKSYFKSDGFTDKSVFLTNRHGSTPISGTKFQKFIENATKPMQYIDEFTSNVVTRAKYLDNIKAGMNTDTAMENADSYAASLIADRSKGALPTLFERKNPLTKLMTMYQVEANNQLRYLFKDLPHSKKDDAIKALVNAMMKYTIGAYLYNDFYEMLVGRRPALDPMGMGNQAIGDFTGYKLPNTVETIGKVASGKGSEISFKTKKKKASSALTTLSENVLQELPFVGGLLGGGRIPISSALPDVSKLAKGTSDLITGETASNKAWQTIGKEIAKPAFYIAPPVFGGAAKKAIEGATAVAKGGSYDLDNEGNEKLRFAVEDKSLPTYMQAMLFGQYSLPEGQEYINDGFKTQTAKYTSLYKEALAANIDGDIFRKWMEDSQKTEGDKTKKGYTIPNSKMKNAIAQLNKYELSVEQKKILLRAAGYDIEKITAR